MYRHSSTNIECYNFMMKMERDVDCLLRAHKRVLNKLGENCLEWGTGESKVAKVSMGISLTSLAHIFTLQLFFLFIYILWRVSLSTWIIFYH